MFVRNAWYCAGWDYELTQGRQAILARQIAGERVVLYRKPDGGVVALEDRCPHRQAALSLGQKEGDSLRCMYHGMRFGPDGKCNEIPGQSAIPERACLRSFPVVEKDNWIWVWMGDAAKADAALICHSVGPGDPEWNIRTSKMHVKTNYRLEVANLADLSHLTWIHKDTLGGTDAYTRVKAKHTLLPRGVHTEFWVRSVAPVKFAQHLFPPGMLFDQHFDITHTLPCNWIMHFKVYAAGTATEGPSDGQLLLDTWTCQTVTPADADSVDYYFSWGAHKSTDFPGLSDLLRDILDVAFMEDARVLEAQHLRMKEKPDLKMIDIVHDAGPGKMLWVLDRLLKEEAKEAEAASLAA